MKRITEIGDTPKGQYALGAVAGRAIKRAKDAREKGNMGAYQKNMSAYNDADNAIAKGRENTKGDSYSNMYNSELKGYNYGYRKINESQLRNIIRESLCEIMDINAEEYNRYLDYIKNQKANCARLAEYLNNNGIDARVTDYSAGGNGNLQEYRVYVPLSGKSEIEIQNLVRKQFPDATFSGGMAGMHINP